MYGESTVLVLVEAACTRTLSCCALATYLPLTPRHPAVSSSDPPMEKMLHAAPVHATLPECFIFPADKLPQAKATSGAVSLPIIDLSLCRDEVRRAILDAGKEIGFFQACI